jgi:hypothetical protein
MTMAVVISNETGLDLHLQILPEGEDGLRVKVFLKKPAKRPRDAQEFSLKKTENLTLFDRAEDTKVFHDQRALGFALKTALHRGSATHQKSGDTHPAIILTFSLPN